MEKIKEATYQVLRSEIIKRCYSIVYYSRGIDIIPNLLDMGLLSREDVTQEFMLAIITKARGEHGEPVQSALKALQSALKEENKPSINRNIKFLMLYNSFTVINTITRHHGIKKLDDTLIEEPFINDRTQLGLSHLFAEYSIDKANDTVKSAIYKRMEGITLTPTERQALSRFVKKFRQENQ